MTTGGGLRREDDPLPGLEDYLRVVACAAALVRTAGPLGPQVATVGAGRLGRLAAALDAAGVNVDNDGVAGGEESR